MTIEFRIKNGMEKCLETFGFKRFSFLCGKQMTHFIAFPRYFFYNGRKEIMEAGRIWGSVNLSVIFVKR